MIKIKHYGDITKIDGHKVEIPNIITGGSPCQDLSVAGKREGLAGERSGLFMEQIRVTKELREQDVKTNGHLGMDINPRFFVWENVVGALSSGNPKGEDFRIVLEEVCKIADSSATIPRPSSGKWSNAGCIMGDGWSVAWRVHDAQFWGVAQRRRRLSLVADLGGTSAPEILFERKGVSRYSESSERQKQRIAGYFSQGTTDANREGKCIGNGQVNQGFMQDKTGALNCMHDQQAVVCLEGNGSRPSHRGDGYAVSDVSYTLNSTEHHAVAYGIDGYNQSITGEKSKTLSSIASDSDHVPCVAYGMNKAFLNQGVNAKGTLNLEEEKIGSQVASGVGGVLITPQ